MRKKFLKRLKSTPSFQHVDKVLIFKGVVLKKGVESVWNVLECVDEFLSFQHNPHRFRVNSLIIKCVDVWKIKAVLTPPFFQVEFLKS